MGFDIRDQNAADVDDELDVDGDDEAMFGDAQFTEGDIVPLHPEEDINVEDDDIVGQVAGPSGSGETALPEASASTSASGGGRTLRDLVAAGKVVRRAEDKDEEVVRVDDTEQLDEAVNVAQATGDKEKIIAALERKVQQMV